MLNQRELLVFLNFPIICLIICTITAQVSNWERPGDLQQRQVLHEGCGGRLHRDQDPGRVRQR